MAAEVLDISRESHLEIFQKEVLQKEVRYEQVGKLIYLMAFPSKEHQRIIAKFIRQLGNYLDTEINFQKAAKLLKLKNGKSSRIL
jgi:Uma2 family endonuclease